ncbi:MAG: hypothetical protein JJU02_04320 [Cryomorphaceae bacterium]|nr:hypothetical protein [Cryomorphaceae bacterium]
MRQALLLIGFCVIFISGCRKCDDPCNKECDNYDPCCGIEDLSAEFSYYENVSFGPWLEGIERRIIKADTVLDTSPVLFRADFDEADEYIWTVGNDPREWREREFALRFRDVPSGTSVPVTLTVRKKTDRICDPDAQDEVSFSKNVVVVRPKHSPFSGKYQGRKRNYPDELITVEFKLYNFHPNDPTPIDSNKRPQIDNLFPNCGGKYISVARTNGYNFMYFNFYHDYYCCFEARGFAWVNQFGELEIEFEHYPFTGNSSADSCSWNKSDEMVKDYFKGKRVL